MLALLSEYKRTADPKVLDALVKCADNIMANVGDGKRINNICLGWWYGLVSSSILEPFVGVYKYTGDKKYLDYAEWIVSCWATSKLKPDLLNKGLANTPVVKMFAPRKSVVKIYQDGGESKAYEMMSCYEGLIELYRATGNEDYKKAVLNTARQIAEREITAIGSGSIWERWVDGKFLQQEDSPYWMETCVSTTWIKLCAQLLRLSADPVYADYAELAAYNALAGAQGADGKWWSYFAPLKGARNPSPEQVKMHISCCVASGPRGLFILPKIAYTADSSDGLYVNFYENGEAKLEIPAFGASATLKVSEVDFGAEKLPGQKSRFPCPTASRRNSPSTREFRRGAKTPKFSSTAKNRLRPNRENTRKSGGNGGTATPSKSSSTPAHSLSATRTIPKFTPSKEAPLSSPKTCALSRT